MRSGYKLNNTLSCIKRESQQPSIRRLSKGFSRKEICFSRQMADDHDAQNQRQISAQMGRTVCDRNNLFKWSISPYDFRRRLTHDANQWQVLKEVLSLLRVLLMIKLTLHLLSRPSDQYLAENVSTPLIPNSPTEWEPRESIALLKVIK